MISETKKESHSKSAGAWNKNAEIDWIIIGCEPCILFSGRTFAVLSVWAHNCNSKHYSPGAGSEGESSEETKIRLFLFVLSFPLSSVSKIGLLNLYLEEHFLKHSGQCIFTAVI